MQPLPLVQACDAPQQAATDLFVKYGRGSAWTVCGREVRRKEKCRLCKVAA